MCFGYEENSAKANPLPIISAGWTEYKQRTNISVDGRGQAFCGHKTHLPKCSSPTGWELGLGWSLLFIRVHCCKNDFQILYPPCSNPYWWELSKKMSWQRGQFDYLLAVSPWANYLSSVSLSYFICKMEIVRGSIQSHGSISSHWLARAVSVLLFPTLSSATSHWWVENNQVGIFTPWKLAKATHQSIFFFGELTVKHFGGINKIILLKGFAVSCTLRIVNDYCISYMLRLSVYFHIHKIIFILPWLIIHNVWQL